MALVPTIASRPPRPDDPLSTAEQMAAVDARAAREYGLPGAVLMESAGRACAARLEALARAGTLERRALTLCGPGNNGGDGLVIARTLAAWGWRTQSRFFGETEPRSRFSAEAALQLDLADRLDASPTRVLTDGDLEPLAREFAEVAAAGGVVVDALFGTGLSRPLEGRFAGALDRLAASGAAVFAVDAPSGLDADTGAVLGTACPARWTTTLAALKPGLLPSAPEAPGAELVGELELAEIGMPRPLLDELPRVGAAALGA